MDPDHYAPLSTEEIVYRVLEKQLKWEAFDERLDEFGLSITGMPNMDPLETALDLLGVPPDNTVEMIQRWGDLNETGVIPSGTYCRNFLYMMWYEYSKKNPPDLEGFVRAVRGEVAQDERMRVAE